MTRHEAGISGRDELRDTAGPCTIRVANIVGKWNGYGVETLTSQLAKHIDPSQIELYFFIDEDSQQVPRAELEALGHRVVLVPPYQRVLGHWRSLKREFARLQIDIVHAHMSTLSPISLSAAARAGVRLRIVHTHTMLGEGEYAKNAVKRGLRPFSGRWATHFATSSRYAAKWLYGSRVRESDIFYLPVARDLGGFAFDPVERERIRHELGLASGAFVLGHLGRFVAQKNHRFLLEIFRAVKEVNAKSVLVLAGDGPLVDDTKLHAERLGVAGSVHFLGQRSDAPSLYQGFDVFVLPSLYEGVPGTGVEAQASGLPFIYADTVTEEAQLLDSTRRLPLEAGPEAWAAEICATRDRPRNPDALAVMDERGFGIQGASRSLVEYYGQLVAG